MSASAHIPPDDRADDDRADDARRRGHEPDDTYITGVVGFSAGLLVLIGVCLVALVGLYGWFAGDEGSAPTRFSDVQRVPPPPRLQQEPAVDLAELHRRTRRRLHTYGWVDSSRGFVHIPIRRAMRLVARRGLPYDTSAAADSLRRVISESGFALERRGPPPPSAPAYLGRSPEPFVPSPLVLRELLHPGAAIPNWEQRAVNRP